MTSILKPFLALYTSMFLFALSLGLLNTFLSLRLSMEGFPPRATGLILASYFIGAIVGTLYCNKLIKQVGHIRSFAAFAAVYTAMIMLHGCFMSGLAWGIFRFFSGVAVIGLFMVIESWLNECSQSDTRGRIFSIYMVMTYLGVSIGQQFLNLGKITDQTLFFVVGFLVVSCMIPITLTRSIHPEIIKMEPFEITKILKKAPMGILGCFTSGMLISSFHTMGPVFCLGLALNVSQISYFMTITVLGGLLIQWPIGTLSDRFDRSKVIPIIGCLISLMSVLIIMSTKSEFWIFLTAMGLFGGFMFSIYPVSVARAHDLFEPKDVVNVSSALLLSYSIGAVIGPIASAFIIELVSHTYGFFFYFAAVSLASVIFSLILRHKEMIQTIPVKDQVDFIIMDQTSQMALHIDPRSDIQASDSLNETVNPNGGSSGSVK